MLSLGVKAISSDTLGNRKYIGLSADCEIKKQLPLQTRTGEVSIWRPLNEIFTSESYVPVQVYSLQGLYVGDTLENLPHGIYVVRQGGNVYKVMQK